MSAGLDDELTMLEGLLHSQRIVLNQTACLGEHIADQVADDETGAALAVVQRRAGVTDDTVVKLWPTLSIDERRRAMGSWLDSLDDLFDPIDGSEPRIAAVRTSRLSDPVRIGDLLPDLERHLLSHSSETAPDCIKKGFN